MALRTAGFRPAEGPARGRNWCFGLVASILVGVSLAGCSSAVETYRSLAGVNRNDPDPQTAPFSGNLADAEAAPYPNLASVPPPPTHATTAAERQKLAQSLIADRTATAADAGIPPPAAPPARPGSANIAAAPPRAATPPVSPSRSAAPPAVAALPAAATAAPVARSSTGGGETKTASAAATPAPAVPDKKDGLPTGASAASHRKPGEPPEPMPQNSTLEMPQVRSVPEPETARPPPPPPKLAAVPAAPPPAALPPAMASVAPIEPPPPPPPTLAPAPPAPPARSEPKPAPSAPTVVAKLDISGGAADRTEIERVAAAYRAAPGTVRVIAYAAVPASGDPLAGYNAALNRAQGIAKALSDAGVPAAKIQTQASPAAGAQAGRVEIQLAP